MRVLTRGDFVTDRVKKIVYLVTEDWAFRRHRLPMARAARDAGFEVIVATRVSDDVSDLEAEGFRFAPLSWRRRSLNPLSALRSVWEITRIYRRERPDLVHHVAVKPILLGGIAAWFAGVPAIINAFTGLGTLFIGSGGVIVRAVGIAARSILRFILMRSNTTNLFENADDLELLIQLGVTPVDRSLVIRGSGVDTDHFPFEPEPPEPPVTVAFAGRLIGDKGIRELVEAFRELRSRGLAVRLVIAGAPDLENPTSVTQAELDAWGRLDGVVLTGPVSDVRPIWRDAHIAVLLSRREGVPVSLMEAAATGRAIVATDVPGCREVVMDKRNGFLVPLGDHSATVSALERLIRDTDTRRRFGVESWRLVETELSATVVAAAVRELYLKAVNPPP